MRWNRLFFWLVTWFFFFFSQGRWSFALAAWVGPALLLRFLRTSQTTGEKWASYFLLASATIAQWWGAWGPMRGPLLYSGVAAAAFFLFFPYWLDARLRTKEHPFLWTLLFPCAWVSVDLLASVAFADVLFIGHTQIHWRSLVQVASIAGVFGVTFFLVWWASFVNFFLEGALTIKDIWRNKSAALCYGGSLSAVLLFGCVRVASYEPGTKVITASFTENARDTSKAADPMRTPNYTLTPSERDKLRAASFALQGRLLERTRAEAQRGARLILWSEVNALLLREDAALFIERAKELSRAENIYIAAPLGIFEEGQPLLENVLVLIAPDGTTTRYRKSFLTPGEPSILGDGVMQFLPSPFGVLSGAICADFANHWLFFQVGERGADIVFDPASEWYAVDPVQTYITAFRAIEQGFSIVKQTSWGPSTVIDPTGDFISWNDWREPNPGVLRSEVPTQGLWTLYSRIGDIFAYACLVALLFFLIQALLFRRPVVGARGSIR